MTVKKRIKLLSSKPNYWHRHLVGEEIDVIARPHNTPYYTAVLTNSQRQKVKDKSLYYIHPRFCEDVKDYKTNQEALSLLKK